MQLPGIETPEPGVVGMLLPGQGHEISHHGVGLRPVFPAPCRVKLGKHGNRIEEVAQVVMVIIKDSETEISTGVGGSLPGDNSSPFCIIQESVAIEAAVQPRGDGLRQELSHEGDDVWETNFLCDQG